MFIYSRLRTSKDSDPSSCVAFPAHGCIEMLAVLGQVHGGARPFHISTSMGYRFRPESQLPCPYSPACLLEC